MNIYRLKTASGSIIDNPTIEGLTIDFRARGAEVVVHEGALFTNSRIIVSGGGSITIEPTHARGLRNTTIDMSGLGKNRKLWIKEGVSIESARFAMVNESDLYVEIGRGCMLSSNITFRATDGHVIYDLSSREILNKSRPIIVGDNCWIGADAVVMKGSVIANNSVVGSRALVVGDFREENVILAGVPAKIVKRNCGWSRTYIDNYEQDA
ncbi:acyltransferase [Paraburkholderia dinghuensis]|uniref:Acyltransferase n=1 Tax=Paraburkholderia dinghuensis TaxID=2305225 RepID=A0A3N6N1L8_9BURK|nr:acyltransferase [Paraburkholderia dinghuensis]RQH10064.1 acyltransferase [Paraburkholderia dinghuensis]